MRLFPKKQKVNKGFRSSTRTSGRKNVSGKKQRFRVLLLSAILLLFLLAVLLLSRPFSGLSRILPDSSGISESIVQADPESIPDFAGLDYIELNDNMPSFTQEDLEEISGEHYSPLDKLGRCGVAYAMIDASMHPTEERGDIGMIQPSGWVQARYDGYVDSEPPYLYNRSHLIAYALTGQNANERNLITGTRYFNASSMLPFEEQVMRYLEDSENHVLYRVTPYFKDKELVARGVEMEAYSVEDQGRGVCFHVFVYNYQPGIAIDYKTGESQIAED